MATNPSVYSLLVSDPNDVLAALAYTTYKQHKVESMAEIETRTGQSPTVHDLEAFERAASTPSALAMYAGQAETLIQTFLEVTLTARQTELEAEFTATALGQQLATIQINQTANRGVVGWFRDVSANLAVNLMTILVIGSLVFGYKWIEDWSGNLSDKAGVTNDGGSKAAPAAVVPKS